LSFIFDNFLEGANGEYLARAVEMDGNAPAIGVLEKTGRTFVSRKGEPVVLERRDNLAHCQTAQLCVVNRHGS
jgi:hypothetical protein